MKNHGIIFGPKGPLKAFLIEPVIYLTTKTAKLSRNFRGTCHMSLHHRMATFQSCNHVPDAIGMSLERKKKRGIRG